MIGMYIKFLFLIIFISCAKKPVYQAGLDNLDTRYNTTLGERELRAYSDQIGDLPLLQRDRLSFYLDLDKDGIKDYFDFDIDGDGFHNYIDQYPLNDSLGGEDLNNNLLPDFIESKNHLTLQLELVKTGIFLVDLDNRADSQELTKILLDNDLKVILKELDVIHFNPLNLSKRGDYNKDWRVINLYPMAENLYLETLMHESFHHYANIHPESFESFKLIADLQDQYITEYASTDEHENFAETMMYLWSRSKNINTVRFKEVLDFLKSNFYMELKEIKFDFLQ